MQGHEPHAASVRAVPIERGRAGTIHAVVCDRYGGPLVARLADVPRPVIVAGQVLIEVRASSICRGDIHLLNGKPYLVRIAGYGLFRPKHPIPGQNVSGVVIEAASGVAGLTPGDEVFGEIPHGAFAELAAAPAARLALKPARFGHEDAAALPVSGITALQSLRDAGRLRAGQSVLINGASGGVGTLAVQIAKALGADVTAVCGTRHIEAILGLGADRVIDYTREDFASAGLQHDVMLDLAGNRSLADCRRAVKPGGVLVACGQLAGGTWLGPVPRLIKVALTGRLSRCTMTPFMARPNSADLQVLARMADAGQLQPVVDKRFALAEIAQALAHVAAGPVEGTTVLGVVGA